MQVSAVPGRKPQAALGRHDVTLNPLRERPCVDHAPVTPNCGDEEVISELAELPACRCKETFLEHAGVETHCISHNVSSLLQPAF